MPDNELAGMTALVTGASRGFGRGIATALGEAGAQVTGVARDRAALEALRAELGDSFTPVAADAADPMVAGQLIDKYHPRVLVLNAGATPLPRPIQQHTWQTFSRNWDVDVAHAFHWTREALLAPLGPGSTVITLSSGAAVFGSPLSGGYAGAKAAIRWLTAYAADQSRRDALGIRFVSLLPQLTPATALGAVFAAAYAARPGAAARPAHRSLPSRPGRRSPACSPVMATTRTPTCSPPRACVRCPDPRPTAHDQRNSHDYHRQDSPGDRRQPRHRPSPRQRSPQQGRQPRLRRHPPVPGPPRPARHVPDPGRHQRRADPGRCRAGRPARHPDQQHGHSALRCLSDRAVLGEACGCTPS